MSINGQGHSLTLVKGHSDFKVKCLNLGLYTQVSDSGPLGPLVYIYIPIQVLNIQFGLKNNNLLPVVVVGFARVALMFELLQYYSSQEKYRGLWGSAIG